ncbi:MAG TPA: Maf family protein [Lacipirellulaceae bacterium]
MTLPQPSAPSLQPLVLASSSPRRRELLAEAGYEFTVVPPPPDIECGVCSESGPAGLVTELAFRKAQRVLGLFQDEADCREPTIASRWSSRPGSHAPIVLAADTVAECDGFILGKPHDEEDARAMLRQLSGREHRVLTGLCLWRLGASEPLVQVAVTTLRMDPLSRAQLDEYLASGQWEGKAGAFGYQDRLGWVHIVEGSESNVVGLPMELLAELLAQIQSA